MAAGPIPGTSFKSPVICEDLHWSILSSETFDLRGSYPSCKFGVYGKKRQSEERWKDWTSKCDNNNEKDSDCSNVSATRHIELCWAVPGTEKELKNSKKHKKYEKNTNDKYKEIQKKNTKYKKVQKI